MLTLAQNWKRNRDRPQSRHGYNVRCHRHLCQHQHARSHLPLCRAIYCHGHYIRLLPVRTDGHAQLLDAYYVHLERSKRWI